MHDIAVTEIDETFAGRPVKRHYAAFALQPDELKNFGKRKTA